MLWALRLERYANYPSNVGGQSHFDRAGGLKECIGWCSEYPVIPGIKPVVGTCLAFLLYYARLCISSLENVCLVLWLVCMLVWYLVLEPCLALSSGYYMWSQESNWGCSYNLMHGFKLWAFSSTLWAVECLMQTLSYLLGYGHSPLHLSDLYEKVRLHTHS